MTVHEVTQGEYLASIARQYGFSDWHQIYDHAENADFRKRRPNPNLLRPGDRVHIPEKQAGQVAAATGSLHQFEVKEPDPIELRIVLRDDKGNALADMPYTLEAKDVKKTGRTDADGLVKEQVPVGAPAARLSLDGRGLSWEIDIGHLDPVDEPGEDQPVISGVQARLNNLGFSCGDVDGILGPRTEQALKNFQRIVLGREEPDGIPDQATRDALVHRHAS